MLPSLSVLFGSPSWTCRICASRSLSTTSAHSLPIACHFSMSISQCGLQINERRRRKSPRKARLSAPCTPNYNSLFFALINSAASTVWRTSVGLRFKCTADFNFLPNIQSPPASWSVYRCPCKDANRERERGKPSKLGGVMKQKREWHSRGMWECVPTNLCLALWWMVSPWTWAARHPNTCGSISCQLHVLGLAQQSKRMTHSYFFKVEKIFEYYLHECAPWRHHAIAAFCRL